jgi:carboxymethylenebutenolidase
MKAPSLKIPAAILIAALATSAVAQTAPTTPSTPAPAPAAGSGTMVHPISKNILGRLTQSPRHFDIVKIKQGDREVETYVFYPMTKDKAMAVVLIHEIFGLSDWIRAAGDQLAEAGYIVLVPDLLSGEGPNHGGTTDLPETQVTTAVNKLPPAQVLADVNAVVDYGKKLDACNGNIALGGFCWGGGKAFAVAAENKDIKAAFVFYGAPMLPMAQIPNVTVPVYGFYGQNDARISGSVPAEADAMKAAGKTYDAIVYPGADHGFMRLGQMDNPTPGNKQAAEDSWKRLLGLLAKINSPAPASATK